ncbi:hypothetical protein F-LCD7_0493 [Faustovirus]|nr:hypothetical protein F-LCD7_0493 [Faustovirus]
MSTDATETLDVDVVDRSTLLSSIRVLNGAIVDYTLQQPDAGIHRIVTRLAHWAPVSNSIKLHVVMYCEDNDDNNDTSVTFIYRYTYVYSDLLCWIYSFHHRRVYSYLNGEFLESSAILPGVTVDDI